MNDQASGENLGIAPGRWLGRSSSPRGRGLTITEVLVVIAILGVLVALILPAIQRARESARRAQCANNLHQLAVAVSHFESVKRRLPNSGTFGVTSLNGGPPVIDWFSPKRSWVVDLLPFIEQLSIYNAWTFEDPDPS